MLKLILLYISLLYSYFADLFFRAVKFIKFLCAGKHEIQRICESSVDIYEKTTKVDQWLTRTRDPRIQQFLQDHVYNVSQSSKLQKTLKRVLSNYQRNDSEIEDYSKKDAARQRKNVTFNNLEDCDIILSSVLRDLSKDLYNTVVKVKKLHTISMSKCGLSDILYRILSYRVSLIFAEKLAAIKYDSSLVLHLNKLLSLWNHLVQADQNSPSTSGDLSSKAFPPELSDKIVDGSKIVSSRWSHIGFQGEDPGTDFRGMGLLGLIQLEYLSRKPKSLARDLLIRSLNEKHNYPFAIVGINLTYNLLNLFKDGSMKHLYYDTNHILFRNDQRTLSVLGFFNDLYVELFLRFDCFWHESKPESIFEFKSLMEKFVSVVRMDLCNRNFSLKFIY